MPSRIRTRTTRALLATTCLLAALALDVKPAAALSAVVVGDCAFVSVSASYSPAITAVPSATTISLSGSGTCVVNGQIGSVSFGVIATSPAYSCVGGVAAGSFQLTFNVPGFHASIPGTIAIVNAGSTITAALTSIPVFAGVAEFAALPVSGSQSCLTGSLSSTSWAGDLVFEDPDLSDITPR
jgi:hypothetical protein